ncbi:MAG TPA: TIGR03435 family protein [Candidatus Acidoferrales bacterium]|jgi:uncharacterized protein (TIGR03435 family)|nr:TIGR03435 family protein [Candidatus Acidoferrales bacterium]
MKQTLVAVSWISSCVLAASGQPTADAPEFEVASVKPAATPAGPIQDMLPLSVAEQMGFRGGPGSNNPGRIDYSGVSLKMLLARAYKLRPDQISGPGWLDTERYEIVAKVPPGTDAERLRLMLQKLLTERFQIRLHRETKALPVYRLTVARNGPKLKPAEALPDYKDDAERIALKKARASAALAPMMRSGEFGPRRSFHLPSATPAKFAETLSSRLDRPVKDMTQLEGLYAFTLNWVPDNAQPMGSTGGAGRPDDTPSGPSLFTAVEEQLGLKLESGKEQIELLVIDNALKLPTNN